MVAQVKTKHGAKPRSHNLRVFLWIATGITATERTAYKEQHSLFVVSSLIPIQERQASAFRFAVFEIRSVDPLQAL